MKYNSTRLVRHITTRKCQKYDPQKQDRALGVTQVLLKHIPVQITQPKTEVFKQQTTLNLGGISRDDRLQLDALAALAVYGDARPFGLFESPYMRAFLKKLNPAYEPPSRNRLDTTLLAESYEDCQEEVEGYLATANLINVIFDETTGISGKRVINLIAYTERGPFFYRHVLIPRGEAATADNFVKYLLPVLRSLCDEDYLRLNSFSTDTCATMRKWWRLARAIPELSHCLFIPCDSHGLQLLIKDILELPDFKPTMKTASRLVKSFHHSGKRLDLLRTHQIIVTGKTSSLTASIITRWGTQFRMLQSIHSNRQALAEYCEDANYERLKSEKKQEWVRPTIRHGAFFNLVSTLLRLLKPIHEAQVMSESNHSNLMLVVNRWQSIELHLTSQRESLESQGFNFEAIHQVFLTRRRKQLRDDHFLAHYLLPTTIKTPLAKSDKDRVFRALQKLVRTEEDFLYTKGEFFNFRAQRDVYALGASCWKLNSSPIHFWDDCESDKSILPNIARRLASTIANSVPSERAFSTMNLIHSKTRNRLSPERVEQQVFIHINRRILDSPVRQLFRLSDEDLVKFETIAQGLQEKEKESHLHRGRDEASDISDSDSDPEASLTSDSEVDDNHATATFEPLTQPILQPNYDKSASSKRRNSATHESRCRPQFQPQFSTQLGESGLPQYASQGQITEQSLYNGYGQSQAPVYRQIEVPNRPYSTHIDRDYFGPAQLQPALLPRPAGLASRNSSGHRNLAI
jgi:hypothetical protein